MTKGTVDEGIHAMATRKTRLDAAVLDGITASSKAGAAAETLQVLHTLCSSCIHENVITLHCTCVLKAYSAITSATWDLK